jgi:phosphoribosylformylglycinamidine cyclo-ligase
VQHADGAGTKTSLAYIYWRESGDLSVWRGVAQDAVVMNVDDLLCVGAVDNMVLSSTLDRNKQRIPGDVVSEIIHGTEAFLKVLRDAGLNIVSAGGETADVGDLVRTVTVNCTVTARLKREEVIDNSLIKAGDVIVGLCSYGQAKYEREYNAGMGSNGLTSARHDLLSKVYAEKYAESFDPGMAKDLVYTGSKTILEPLPGTPLNVGKAILSPTRTYAPIVKCVLDEMRADIHGMIHCSGGGQTKILHFIDKCEVVKDNLFPCPPLFSLIQAESGTTWKEMYQVFNMGHRFEFYIAERFAEKIIKISQSFGVDAQIVGRVEPSSARKLTIKSSAGEFEY